MNRQAASISHISHYGLVDRGNCGIIFTLNKFYYKITNLKLTSAVSTSYEGITCPLAIAVSVSVSVCTVDCLDKKAIVSHLQLFYQHLQQADVTDADGERTLVAWNRRYKMGG